MSGKNIMVLSSYVFKAASRITSTGLIAPPCSQIQHSDIPGIFFRNSRFNYVTSRTTTSNANQDKEKKEQTNGMVQIPIDTVIQKTTQALQKLGWSESHAKMQAEMITNAEIYGNNQGLVKLVNPSLMKPSPDASEPIIERETMNSAVYNGSQGAAMVVASLAADLAVDKVIGGKQQENKGDGMPLPGISCISMYNTCTSSGRLGYYVEKMANKGVIGIAFANSPEFVSAAPGGKKVYGTNPLAVGIPTAKHPIVLDMATSAIALFGVITAKARGEKLPPNVAYDKHGNWTQDASETLDGGAIATFGGHKGAGLALCVEILAGVLSGGAVLGRQTESKSKNWGHTFIAIRPDAFVDDFESKVDSVIECIKESVPEGDVRIAGERSAMIAAERKKAGILPIPETVWESICSTAEKKH